MSSENKTDGRTLWRFRDYLLMQARVNFPDWLRGKLGPEDIVQSTLLEAHRDRSKFKGDNSGQMARWLEAIQQRNIKDKIRQFSRGKRAVARERSLDASTRANSARLIDLLPAPGASPSGRVDQAERLRRVASLMAALPVAQRQVIELRRIRGLTIKETARKMGRSQLAVSALLRRGLERLAVVRDV